MLTLGDSDRRNFPGLLGRKIPISHCLLPVHPPVLCKVETGNRCCSVFPLTSPNPPLLKQESPGAPPWHLYDSAFPHLSHELVTRRATPSNPASQHRESPGERQRGWRGQTDAPQVAFPKMCLCMGRCERNPRLPLPAQVPEQLPTAPDPPPHPRGFCGMPNMQS